MSESLPGVLIVDDDRIVASSIAELLSSAGYAAVTATSADDALHSVEDHQLGASGGYRRPLVPRPRPNRPKMAK